MFTTILNKERLVWSDNESLAFDSQMSCILKKLNFVVFASVQYYNPWILRPFLVGLGHDLLKY